MKNFAKSTPPVCPTLSAVDGSKKNFHWYSMEDNEFKLYKNCRRSAVSKFKKNI
jgi:hypothetical protein